MHDDTGYNLKGDGKNEPSHNLNPRRLLIWKETIENLSDEARQIVNILLTSPTEILKIMGTEPAKAVRGAIYKHLWAKGWKWRKIWDSFREIREALRNS